MFVFGYGNKFSGLSRAIIAILAGLVLIIWPGLATTILVQAVAVFIIIRALLAIIFGGKDGKGFVSYFIEVLFAIVLLMGAEQIASFMIYIVAFLLILMGLYQVFIVGTAFSAVRGGCLLSFLPGLVILSALFLLFAGGKAWVSYLAGAALILYGISDILSLWTVQDYAADTFKDFTGKGQGAGRWHMGRKHSVERNGTSDPQSMDGPGSGIDYEDVKDVDYEKVDEQ